MIFAALDKIRNAADMVLRRLKEEWRAQGHSLTGDTERSMYSLERATTDGVRIEFWMNDYAAKLNRHTPPHRIPYTPGTGWGTGAQRAYLEGLAEYAKKRIGAASEREAAAIAFAIARAHKREGMPTKASARFSKTGKRTEWIDDAVDDIEPAVREYLESVIFEQINKFEFNL